MRSGARIHSTAIATLGLWLSVAATLPVRAETERVTACPSLSPADGQTPLIIARVVHSPEGIAGYPDADFEQRRETRTYAMWNYEPGGYREASIECGYGTQLSPARTTLGLTIPGLLLKCELVYDEPPRRPYPPIFESFWCTSRIEAPAL